MLEKAKQKTKKRNGQLVQDIGTLPLSGRGCPACPKIFSQRGQQILEYAVVMLAVVGAFTAMKLYAQRGLQAFIKSSADQIGRQNESLEQSVDDGYARSETIRNIDTLSNDITRVNSTGLARTRNSSSISTGIGRVDTTTKELVDVIYEGN